MEDINSVSVVDVEEKIDEEKIVDKKEEQGEKTQNIAHVLLTDEQLTRLLDVQEADRAKWDETIEHIFELGLSARENSIKAANANRARKAQAEAQEGIAHMLRVNPALATAVTEICMKDPSYITDAAKLHKALMLRVVGAQVRTA